MLIHSARQMAAAIIQAVLFLELLLEQRDMAAKVMPMMETPVLLAPAQPVTFW
jgi:hypothetical protein